MHLLSLLNNLMHPFKCQYSNFQDFSIVAFSYWHIKVVLKQSLAY